MLVYPSSLLPRNRDLCLDLLVLQHVDILLLNALLRQLISSENSHTLILPKLARRQSRLKHLVNLFQGAVLNFRKEEEYPRGSDDAGREPDISVPRAPVEGSRVDKVRCGKRSKPRTRKSNCGSDPERVASQPLRGNLATSKPRVCANHAVVAEHVDTAESNDDGARRFCAGLLCVHDGNNEL